MDELIDIAVGVVFAILLVLGCVLMLGIAIGCFQKPIHYQPPKPTHSHRCHSCGEIYVSDEDNAVCPVCGEKF